MDQVPASRRGAERPSPAVVATLVVLALSIFINYIDRGNLGTAATLVKSELHLSATQLGLLLTAVFITYVPMQPLVGWLVDRFGGSPVLVVGFAVWSVATAISGYAADFGALFGLRLLLGIGESVTFPAVARIVAEIVPPEYLGFANGITQSGLSFGPAFGVFFGGLLIAAHGWRWFFVVFGICSLLWLPAWLGLSRVVGSARVVRPAQDRPSMKLILRERSLWGASLAHFCANYSAYFVLTWIPYYLVHERHWSIQQMAAIAGSAFLVAGCAQIASGWLADRFIHAGISATITRKTSCGIGAAGVAICMVGCAYSNNVASAVWLILACAIGPLLGVNTFAIPQTIAGAEGTGRWVGIQNMLGNISGLIAPALTGILVDRTGNFILPFVITAIVSLASGAAWIFLVGRVEPIDWKNRARTAPPIVPQLAETPSTP